MTPIVKVLRMCDGNKPIMGIEFDRMLQMADRVQKVDVPWAATAADMVEPRWEYFQSFMHGAFNPEVFEHRNNWDDAVLTCVTEVIERLRLQILTYTGS